MRPRSVQRNPGSVNCHPIDARLGIISIGCWPSVAISTDEAYRVVKHVHHIVGSLLDHARVGRGIERCNVAYRRRVGRAVPHPADEDISVVNRFNR